MNNLYTQAELSKKVNQLDAGAKMQEAFIHIIHDAMAHSATPLAHAQKAIEELQCPRSQETINDHEAIH